MSRSQWQAHGWRSGAASGTAALTLARQSLGLDTVAEGVETERRAR
ncbi:hypothetical protein O4214_09005 [Rhodococcus erythropolis]|nr:MULTISPECIES: hypothetical protein [Rhodococcus erythropolis group]MCD2105286.1 hypothetical protein [Rhodococcus qingshengii]MCZ4524112.1 hypothetical protein [Rhodococcus erythropolis]